MDSERREIQENEIILLISKYLSENGYIKTEKVFRKENALRDIDFGEMHYVKDLKTILNEYIQLKSKSLAQEELSHTVSLSMGPEIEKTFKHLEALLSDYAAYRQMIESQVGKISESYELDQPSVQQEPQPVDSPDNVSTNGLDLPMEQYLQLYRTLPSILPDVINDTLNKNQVLDDSAVNSILSTLEKNPLLSDMLPFSKEPAKRQPSKEPSASTDNHEFVDKRTKES
ncbi:hypothetical protein WA538_004666, partial [Blastocystis sp. DL]